MGSSLFQLPDELLLTTLTQTFPCRDAQIRTLATLLWPGAAPCRNLVIYGTEATGKSAITAALLEGLSDQPEHDGLSLRYAIANSVECVTSRHLYETVVGKVAIALRWDGAPSRCETVSQLAVELSKMLRYTPRPDSFRFVLVFDGIDRQRDTPHTLLPALARLSEIIPSLTTVFIVTSPAPSFLRISSVPHLHFPTYSKPEFISILSTTPPAPLPNTTPSETADLWARFTAAVHDALARAASRTLPSFRHACTALWPRFTAPIQAGTHTAREFSRLLVAARMHFQDERLLDPGVLGPNHRLGSDKYTTTTSTTTGPPTVALPKQGRTGMGAGARTAGRDLATLLPTTPRLLLLASYLASHNATRHDLTLFSTHHHGRRRRGGLSSRGGGQRSKHRKIARKLLGAHAFVLERMLAIFAAVRGDWEARAAATVTGGGRRGGRWEEKEEQGNADIGMAIATLASLRLLVRVGGAGDLMDCGGKWRVNVGWEVIRGLGRAVGVEVEEWLID
ncbi:origin recognition complex subunit 5 C-terminus-domain-containing protein [Chaetomium strumarium]|uniref:Origin recognition complex subunit 5 C-terminus-domain-containing protein n=1 Tax=Chaetomium strumarium TaxID=1170767 RepID=A0AAJ0GQT5_9PEZI|nr:origin recognition complex subunit 5 C-terminus-domain-containing protein [Chaetomium strumarium]